MLNWSANSSHLLDPLLFSIFEFNTEEKLCNVWCRIYCWNFNFTFISRCWFTQQKFLSVCALCINQWSLICHLSRSSLQILEFALVRWMKNPTRSCFFSTVRILFFSLRVCGKLASMCKKNIVRDKSLKSSVKNL